MDFEPLRTIDYALKYIAVSDIFYAPLIGVEPDPPDANLMLGYFQRLGEWILAGFCQKM